MDPSVSSFGIQEWDERTTSSVALGIMPDSPLHHFYTAGLVVGHRNAIPLLDNSKPFYLYTGRGPSTSSLHLGHLLPLMFTQALQHEYMCPLVIQMTDDEKFWASKDPSLTLEEVTFWGEANLSQMMSLGFDPDLTFPFFNSKSSSILYPTYVELTKHWTLNQVKHTFGFSDSDPFGRYAYVGMQGAPAFAKTFSSCGWFDTDRYSHCLIPCATDQDPYFRLVRDVAHHLHAPKPSLIFNDVLPSLQGPSIKMSSSKPETAIFLTDSPKTVAKKIKSSFSGGGETKASHIALGGNPDIDVAFLYIKAFCKDHKEVRALYEGYKAGKVFSSEMKKRAIEVVCEVLGSFRNVEK